MLLSGHFHDRLSFEDVDEDEEWLTVVFFRIDGSFNVDNYIR